MPVSRNVFAIVLASVAIGMVIALTDVTVIDAACGAIPLVVAFLWRSSPGSFHFSARFHVPAATVFLNMTILVARHYGANWLFGLYLGAFAVLGSLIGNEIESRRSSDL
jgi:hypothetical protein